MKLSDVMRMTGRQCKRAIDALEYKVTNANNACEHWKGKHHEAHKDATAAHAELAAARQHESELTREVHTLRDVVENLAKSVYALGGKHR